MIDLHRVLLVVAVLLLSACGAPADYVALSGNTMGTTWSATYRNAESAQPEAVQAEFEALLEAVNDSMSTYRPTSEITRFNALGVDEWMGISEPFVTVLSAALEVGALSGGAYDVTAGPLVNAWGFGPGAGDDSVPTPADLQGLLGMVGQAELELQDSRLRKRARRVLDFSSIAKGYGVDVLANALEARGVGDFLVEVGGEMRVAGVSPRGDSWRVAIEQPVEQRRDVAAVLPLTARAIATSGDYRNYFEVDGVRYSHSIDARTGWPVRHDLASVTVVHEQAMLADAWATALTVLGPDDGLALANEQGLAVYFIRRYDQGFGAVHSEAFEPYAQRMSDAAGEQ